MDPGSMSPHRLGDVWDDVYSVLPASVFTRHSGLDPESRPYPVMDPGSMSPRGLGDVRDDVYSVLPANVFTCHSGLDPESITYPLHGSRINVTSQAR